MAGRRRVYGASTSPRYRLKMFDYLSKGGRIPATLVMEAVDAMEDARSRNFGMYQKLAETDLVKRMDEVGVPSIMRGITRALFFHILKVCGQRNITTDAGKAEVIDNVVRLHGLEGTVVERALYKAFGLEPPEREGERTSSQPSK